MIKSISIDRILVPMDYSKPAFQAAWIAFSIARSMKASIALIHIHIQENALRELVVIDQSALAELTDEKFQDILKKIVGDPSYKALQSASDDSVVEFELCTNTPAEEICDYAKKNNVNLIVMGARIHSKIEDLLLGSVSSEVLQKAPCPVTVVH